MRSARWALAVALFAVSAVGQVKPGEFGFVVETRLGGAGDECWGFTCQPRPADVPSPDTVRLTLRAPLGSLYAVFASASATVCQPIPGFDNALVIDPLGSFPVFVGVVSTRNPLRFCYDGVEVLQLRIPNNAPVGARLALQAVGQPGNLTNPQAFALSSAVVLTVR